jgi:hypothetical protein|tara:strand:+ start:278 stop:418 length:141 start_codon:yes stop_codon:yes gene_type:complete
MDELDQVLQIQCSDGNVRQSEKNCRKDVYDSADEVTPEFEVLCEPV